MGIGLPSNSFKKIIFLFALLLCVALQEGYGQSTGDLSFVGFNSDSPGDGFSVVLFTSYSAGEQVHFTSEEWDGNSFAGSGGSITWEAPVGGTSPGTVLVFSDVEGTPSVSTGAITDDINMNLAGSGDVIYGFLGPDKDTPNTFLGAVASDASLYNQPNGTEGTLANTGLTEVGNETILLTDNIDVAEFTGDRSGNTPAGYRSEFNDIANNWQEENGNGDQSELILPFDDTSFTIIAPPTIAFSSAKASGDEGNSVNLTVELLQANNVDVDVDVVFLSSSSTAGSSDINSFSSQTVTFTGASTGTMKNVSVTLTGNDGFEDTEKAVFQLQNNTTGSIISPRELTLSITDDGTPDIFINEIHADPASGLEGDADGNGIRDGNDDEFVEFVNNQDTDINISNWKFYNEADLKHVFPSGTVIPANSALVLFADDGARPQGNFGGAVVQSSNESATLSLVNGGDTISLHNADGNVIVSVNYPEAGNDQSIVRSGDSSGGTFIDHSDATGSGDALFSPGTKVDGTAFGSKYAIGIRGSAGWRMISTPTENTSFTDLFGNLWMQGVTGSNDPSGELTLAGWSEDQMSFTVPSSMSNSMTPGKGYIAYVFEDDELNSPGIQGGFPKVISTDGTENGSTVNVTVSATDADGVNGIDGKEGWNLLGNPFGTDLSVGSLISALEDVDPGVNANVYVWDHEANSGNGDYVTLSSGDRIAPFQAFFVRFTNAVDDGTVTFDQNALEANAETQFYKNNAENSFAFDVELHGEEYFDSYSIEFSENGTIDLDRYDAYKLFSLNANSINLFSIHGDNRLQRNMLPIDLETNLEIPLSFDANGRTNLTFRWDNIDDLPSDWDVMLIDKEENREIDLHIAEEYQFTMSSAAQKKTADNKGLLNKREGGGDDSRFVLSLSPNFEMSSGRDIPESVKLNPNYPNPFNPQTTIPYEIAEDAEVKLTVWNMIGQKVATLVDGMVEAGTHEETWNANNMPSGIYIARFEVGNEVFTRKMTLIK